MRKIRIFLQLVLFLILAGCVNSHKATNKASKPFFKSEVLFNPLSDSMGYHNYRIPSLLTTQNGTISSEILSKYTKHNNWYTKELEQSVSVANGTGKPAKKKIEVLTANYDLSNPRNDLMLF